jgi:riboflavin synthase
MPAVREVSIKVAPTKNWNWKAKMFTGIVEEMGTVTKLVQRSGATLLTIAAQKALQGIEIGHSIAVNGICLTVMSFDPDEKQFSIEAVPETLRRTNLGRLTVGSPVNLERSVSAGQPMGGHYVQGHIDGTATVARTEPEGEAINFYFETSPELMRYIVPKGFIAIDGASLTVVDVTPQGFSLTLIPHTQQAVVMGRQGAGYVANLEIDVVAKYTEKIISSRLTAFEERLHALEKRNQ